MRFHDELLRAVALALLLGFPASAGARLAIDVLAASASQGQVESQNTSGCAWNHDHRVCLQAHQAPWVSSGSSSATSPALPRPYALGPARETLPRRPATLSLGPRAPPLLV